MSVLAELFSGGRMRALASRSLENPAVSLNDPAAYDYLVDGSAKSSAGVCVTPRSALTSSELWRAINLIANDIAKTPIHVYRRDEVNGRDRDRTHPAYALLRYRPNPYMTAFVFKQTLQAHKMMRGNGYAHITRNGAGEPTELLPLNPYSTYPVRVNGVLWYVTHVGTAGTLMKDPITGAEPSGPVGEPRKLRAEDVLHIRGLGFDGLIGYDVIQYATESLGLSLGLRKYSSVFFKNGAHLGVVLEHPGALGEEAAGTLRRSWESMHSGLDNAHKTAVLEEGMKANVLSLDARKAQLMEVRQFEARSIANFMGIPPYMLGDDKQQAFASLEQRSQDYRDQAIDPNLCVWEEEAREKLLTEQQKEADTHFIEFNRDALIRVDYKTQREGMALEVNNGLANVDEARALLNRPPLPDGAGQPFRMPSNHVIIEGPKTEDPAAAAAAAANDELNFKRQVVLAYINDGTISDVMFNMTDAGDLLTDVNVTTQPDYEEPWLPVLADNGQPVTGDVVTDPQGDVVGGATEKASAPSGNSKLGTGNSTSQEPGDLDDDDNGQQGEADDPAGDEDPDETHGRSVEFPVSSFKDGTRRVPATEAEIRAAYAAIVRSVRARQGAALQVWRQTWERVLARAAGQAERAARRPERFVAWVEEICGDRDLVGSIEPAARLVGQPAAAAVQRYHAWLRSELLGLAECRAEELPARVASWGEKLRKMKARQTEEED